MVRNKRWQLITLTAFLIGIMLGGVVVPFLRNRTDAAQRVKCGSALENLAISIAAYKERFSKFPNGLGELNIQFMGSLQVVCPSTGRDYNFILSSDRKEYILICPSEHKDGPLFYGSRSGLRL